jgi:putative ABC transport system substrate-binding protein
VAPRKVGFLHNGRKASFQMHFAAFVRRMHDFVGEGQVEILERWAGDDRSKALDLHATEVAAAPGVEVVVAAGGPPTALAAQKATASSELPVVFMSVTDPIDLGLVKDLDRPGHMTGIAGLTSEMDLSRLQLLRELLISRPTPRIGVLNNAHRPHLEKQYRVLADAAPGMNVTLVRKDVADLGQIEAAFKSFKSGGERVDAVLVTADSFFNDLRRNVVVFAESIPAIYQWREFAEAGGLMSFGPNILEAYAKVGEYVGLILDGAETSQLPVSLPDRLEFVINLRAAYIQGIKIPALLLSRAELVQHRLRAISAE